MKKLYTVYSIEPTPPVISPSIFLAGPTARNGSVSWRQVALYYLSLFEYPGVVFVPEPAPGKTWEWDYDDQIKWEEGHLKLARCIMFWIPRNMIDMSGMTTNIEWGVWQSSGKVVLGYPENAEKMRYINYYANKHNVPIFRTIEETLKEAMKISWR